MLSKTRQKKISNQTIAPSESPKSFQRSHPVPSHTPSSDTGGRHSHFSYGKVSDERQQILREIEILQNRLELLANRALYASRLQQLSEAPDDFRQSVQLPEAQPPPRKLKNYNGSTVGLSSSHRMILQDQSVERQIHGTDSYYEDPPPLSYRSATDLPNPYVNSQLLNNGTSITALSLPLQKLSQQKSYVEIERISKKSSVIENDSKSAGHTLGSFNEGDGNASVAPKKSGRYNPNHDQKWKTPEEKPGSEMENISDG